MGVDGRAQEVHGDQVAFLDGGDLGGVHAQAWSAATASGLGARPVSAHTARPISRPASAAASTLGLVPEMESSSRMSPGRP